MPAKLILTSEDPKTNQEVPFEKERITIGRRAGNDLQFSRAEMSGLHAAFLYEDGKYFIEDLGSTNGTFLNGGQLPANRKYPLSPEDTVTIAPFQIKLVVMPDIMRTLMEPPQKDGGRKSSGTVYDRPEHLATGTSPHAEQFKPTVAASKSVPPSTPAQLQQPAEAPTPKPAPVPPAPAAAPPKTAAPAAAVPEAPKPTPSPAAQAAPKPVPMPSPPAGVGAPQPDDTGDTEPTPAPPGATKIGDYLWLAIGALCFLGAIGLILYLILGF